MRPVGLRAILRRRLTQLPALKGLRAGSDRVSPANGAKSCSNRLNGGSKGQTLKIPQKGPRQTLKPHLCFGPWTPVPTGESR
jgi:hypothetical protein